MFRQPTIRKLVAPLVSVSLTAVLASEIASQCAPDALLGPGTGIGSFGTVIKSADLDGDDIEDLITDGRQFALDDFNEDGLLDIAGLFPSVRLGLGSNGKGNGSFGPVTSLEAPTPDSVSVFLGSGDGTFSLPVHYRAGTSIGDIASILSADFNADGVLDLAVVKSSWSASDSVAFFVLTGQSTDGVPNGTFGAPVAHRVVNVDAPIRSAVATDLNDDGVTDLVALDYSFAPVYVVIRDDSGIGGGETSSEAATYDSGLFNIGDVELVDVDSDGIRDLIVSGVISVATGENGVALLRGLGTLGVPDGTFAVTTVIPATVSGTGLGNTGLAVTDVNQDGVLDVLTPTIGPSGQRLITVLPGVGENGQGNGTFSQFVHYPGNSQSSGVELLSGDWNEDGMIDLLVGSPLSLHFGRCPDPILSKPTIVSVRDVVNDQGGRVAVAWTRSVLDASGTRMVTGYIVWRRLSLAAALATEVPFVRDPRKTASLRSHAIQVRVVDGVETYWEALDTLPAHFLVGYGYTATTTQDSLPGDNPYTAFFVSAITEDPFLFFESNVDSGYSVDNLKPSKPRGLQGELASNDLFIHWNPNPEQDLAHYAVYRGEDASFTPGPGNQIGAPTDTSFVDSDLDGAYYYKVSAIDVHANESPHALLEPTDSEVAVTVLDLSANSTDAGIVLQWRLSREAVDEIVEVAIQRAAAEHGSYHDVAVGLEPRLEISYRDTDVEAGTTYWYRLVLVGHSAQQVATAAVRVTFDGFDWRTALLVPPIAVGNGEVDLRYTLGSSGQVRLDLYDIAGHRIRSLDRGFRNPGEYVATWDGLDQHGVRVAQGIYLLRLVTAQVRRTQKLVRIR